MHLIDPVAFEQRQTGTLPGHLGVTLDDQGQGSITCSIVIQRHHMSPNGFLHAASVVALADSTAGYGCEAHLPEDALGFTTVELKTNFLGTACSGHISAHGTLVHGGRSTQVWDVIVTDEQDRKLALFRCTQMILWPKAD